MNPCEIIDNELFRKDLFFYPNTECLPYFECAMNRSKAFSIAELKLWRGQKLHEKGLIQLTDYLESQQLNEGYLLIFDHAEKILEHLPTE